MRSVKRAWVAAALAAVTGVLAMSWLSAGPARASTLTDCLARQNVCVAGDARGLVSAAQQAQLERQIGDADIYLAVAPSGPAGYDRAMSQVVGSLSGQPRFTVGFVDSQQRHFGAYSREMLPAGDAGDIAARAVAQHQADQDVFAALTGFVDDVRHEAGPAAAAAADGGPSHAPRNLLIAFGVVLGLAALGFFLVARPVRRRRQRELTEVKAAAQDDLIALSTRLTGRHADISVQGNPEAAEEQGAALTAYERGTAALDAARRPRNMGAVSRAIAEGHYHLACAEALAAGHPRPDRRPLCFFDPRHGMSVADAHWTPGAGGPGRDVPACSACAHKLGQGLEPDLRKVEANGVPVSYVNAGFGPAYWGGYGLAPGLFAGFLLGEALAPHAGLADGYSADAGYGGGEFGGGGDFGGGDFGGGDFGGGDF